MTQSDCSIGPKPWLSRFRTASIALGSLALVLGTALVVLATACPVEGASPPVDALAGSSDECVTCHRVSTPGIVDQYGHSTMAAANVTCRVCHETAARYPGSVEHQGTWVLAGPTAAKCAGCHPTQANQFNQSRHGLPAFVAFAGSNDLTPEQDAQFESIPEGSYQPAKERSALYAIEPEELTAFACEPCHNIGRPAADGSVGRCQKCHLRHEFSLEQARKPETCNNCHIGPDHPQWEIYQESPHGIAYMTRGYTWNWEAKPDSLSVRDLPAATCATCHISQFGTATGTHDVGDRLGWYLFAPVSERRPAWQENVARMQGVCVQCHSRAFVSDLYGKADKAVGAVNEWVKESNAIVQPLKDKKLMTDQPFDQPIDFTLFELWHHWGRTAKFGAWMQGADYTQWHGAYEMLSDLVELRAMADEMTRTVRTSN